LSLDMRPAPQLAVVVAAALSLLIPASARAQDSLRQAAWLRAIVRLQPSAFRALPRAVRRALTERECVIPQTGWPEMAGQPHNVVSGRFTSPQRRDWAVLCSRQNESLAHVLILHGGTGMRVDSLASSRLSDYLIMRGADRRIFVREIKTVTPAIIRDVAKPYADPLPRCLDHDGLQDSFADQQSTFWYKLDGRWLDLGIGGTRLGERWRALYSRPCTRSGRRTR
jgi:hypothetical protein